MASPPRHSRFEFLSRITDNGFTEAWAARNRQTGDRCFIKVPSATAVLPREFISATLGNALNLQQQLPAGAINRAIYSTKPGDDFLIAYPWLAETVAYPDAFLDPATFPELLRQAAVLIDYIHEQGVVHRDLKLSNFVLATHGGTRRLVLTDLDVLAEVNARGDGKVYGTPGLIAPEIETNQAFTARADLYSFGKSLAAFESAYPGRGDAEKIKLLSTRLATESPMGRPEFLIETLHETGWLDNQSFAASLKTLFTLRFLSVFQRRGHRRSGWVRHLVRDRLRLFGLPVELLNDLEAVYGQSPARAGRAVRRLFGSAKLQRLGEYWQLTADYGETRRCFEDIGISLTTGGGSTGVIPDSVVAGEASPGLSMLTNAMPLKRLLQLDALRGDDTQNRREKAVRLHEQADLAMSLKWLPEACELYREALGLVDPDSEEQLTLRRKIILMYQIIGDLDRLAADLPEAAAAARALGDRKAELDLMRQEAWMLAARGRLDEAKALTTTLQAEAKAFGDQTTLRRALLVTGHIRTIEEDFAGALQSSEDLRPHFEASASPDDIRLLRVGMAHSNWELGNYEAAATILDTVLTEGLPPYQTYMLGWIYNTKFLALGRLGRIGDARRALETGFRGNGVQVDTNSLMRYYTGGAWLHIDTGRLHEAEQALFRAMALEIGELRNRQTGTNLQNLTNVAMRLGRAERAEDYGREALSVLKAAQSQVSPVEVKVLLALNDFYNRGQVPWGRLTALLPELIRHRAVFYATTALFHCLVWGNEQVAATAMKAFGSLAERLGESEVPLLRATGVILAGRKKRGRDRVRALKDAVRILDEVDDYFLCLVLCERIGELSLAEQSRRRARSYFEMAHQYAESLGNQPAVERLQQRVSGLSDADEVRKATLDSIISITELLAAEQENETALERILHFAINETGAERGALFFRNSQTDQLTLRASVDCDEESLRELPSVSENLLQRAARQNRPFIVEDALQDSDLNRFKSIVDHSIRSVIALPLLEQGIVRGLLYLDHHTVPARFEHSDITYLRLIANFVSSLLDALEQHRAVRFQAKQMAEEQRQLGLSGTLVTYNHDVNRILRELPQMARTTTDILVRGESGTGKEVLVKMIHELSLRRDKPFIKVNCAAIPESLMATELFGIADRTATGVRGQVGKFEQADNGTLFLDEIGDMSLATQAAVLTAIEEQRIQKPGGRDVHVDIRLVYATNRNLEEMIERGTFRLDLYQRINRLQINIPPLRDRREDIRPLIEHFVELIGGLKVRSLDLSARAWEVLQAYDWPGNVRELRNVVERLIILRGDQHVDLGDLPMPIVQSSRSQPGRGRESTKMSLQEERLRQIARDFDIDLSRIEPDIQAARQPGNIGLSVIELLEREIIRVLLKRNRGNVSQTARDMSMAYNTLRRRIQKYGLDSE